MLCQTYRHNYNLQVVAVIIVAAVNVWIKTEHACNIHFRAAAPLRLKSAKTLSARLKEDFITLVNLALLTVSVGELVSCHCL